MRVFFIPAICLLLFAGSAAQGVPVTDEDVRSADLQRRMTNLSLSDKLARAEAAAARRKKLMTKRYKPEMTVKFSERMAIDPVIAAGFESLLNSGAVKIVKLISPLDCKQEKEPQKLDKCLQENANILEYANGYSFRESKRAVFARSDVALGGDFFVAGRHSVQAIIVDLGDAEIGALKLDSPGVSYLNSIKPSSSEKKMDEEFSLYKNGLTIASFSNGVEKKFSFGKISRIGIDRTYAMRSVAYRPPGADALPKDKDVIVVLRVVKRDKDGATTLVWRELRRGTGIEMKK